jgi:hypothetical protein
VQRSVFRVEAMMASKRPAAPHARVPTYEQTPARKSSDNAQSLTAELALIREIIARNKRDLGGLIGDGKERHMARAADELGAAVDGMETATQKILKAVEVIDDSAKALTASLKESYNRDLAQDIQDNVLHWQGNDNLDGD